MKKQAALAAALLLLGTQLSASVSWAETIEEKRAQLDEIQQQMGEKDAQLEEKKKEIEEVVDILKELDAKSLAMINGGAKMLKARQDMEKEAEKVVLHVS